LGMRNGRRWYSIIIAPHDRSDSLKLRIPGWALWGMLGLFVLGIASLVTLGVLYRAYRGSAAQVELLLVEKGRLEEANRRIAFLEDELRGLAEFNAQVRAWVGLPPDTTWLEPASEVHLAVLGGPAPGVGLSPLDGAWQWPAKGWISRGFRSGSGKEPAHFGIDIVASKDEPVCAARAGRVVFCGWDDRLGNLVVIDHGEGYSSYYGHNADVCVLQNDYVDTGQQIGTIGSTGVSSAPHLHFEIRRDGEAIDPMTMLAVR